MSLSPWQARSGGFHPYAAAEVDALPEVLRREVEAALPPGSAVLSIFGVPPDYRLRAVWGLRRTPEQAIVFTRDGVLVVKVGARAVYLRHEAVLFTRSSLLLLYGRLELAGAVDGEPARAEIEYNTVGWPLLECDLQPFFYQTAGLPPVRSAGFSRCEADPIEQAGLPLKFANGLRHYGLLPGDTLLGVVFQPAIWSQRLGVLQRQVATNTLLALTDAFLIVIDERRAIRHGEREYGYIITHIPRTAVVGAEMTGGGAWEEVTIRMARAGATAERRVLLETDAADRWHALWAEHPVAIPV